MHVDCPHCNVSVYIEELCCGIFRHAVYKDTFEPIDPHSSKEECEKLLAENKVYGCGKPFRIITKSSTEIQKLLAEFKVEACDYI